MKETVSRKRLWGFLFPVCPCNLPRTDNLCLLLSQPPCTHGHLCPSHPSCPCRHSLLPRHSPPNSLLILPHVLATNSGEKKRRMKGVWQQHCEKRALEIRAEPFSSTAEERCSAAAGSAAGASPSAAGRALGAGGRGAGNDGGAQRLFPHKAGGTARGRVLPEHRSGPSPIPPGAFPRHGPGPPPIPAALSAWRRPRRQVALPDPAGRWRCRHLSVLFPHRVKLRERESLQTDLTDLRKLKFRASRVAMKTVIEL